MPIPKPATPAQFKKRLELVEQWIQEESRHQVQRTRYTEMKQALEVIETLDGGQHAGYERSFIHHWTQIRRAMFRDGWGDAIKELEQNENNQKAT